MSEPKLISPMLDNFDMGGPISDHDGVRCCPAMRKDSDDKFIVKIISVPASQTKLDALLLTGAYSDKASALAYFKDVADGIVAEKKALDGLAKLEGFVAFEDCQIVAMDDATGFDVYLLSKYRMTLDRMLAKHPLTQLDAVNLGIDLCQALSVCRRSGYLFVDLKPSNIFIVGDRDYRIGDLGFARLNSLKYESLPDKYRSCYTAPEVEDAFSLLNDTMDIYAAGLVLYQVFNGGVLPFSGKNAPAEAFPAPKFADEEIAHIILKACDPDPAQRWNDPVEMGQAIVNYMQKNGVNDTPLTTEFFGGEEAVSGEPSNEVTAENPQTEELPDAFADDDVQLRESEVNIEDIAALIEAEDIPDVQDEGIEQTPDDDAEEETAEVIEAPGEVAACGDEESPAEAPEADDAEVMEAAIPADEEMQEPAAEPEEEFDNLSFLNALGELEIPEDIEETPEGIAEILDQADALAAHQVPDPVIAPDPVEVKIPDPISTETVPEEADEEITDDADVVTDDAEPVEDAVSESEDEEISEDEKPYVPKKKRKGLAWVITLLILAAIAVGGYFFYTEYYLQTIHSLDLVGTEDRLQVQVTADIDETLLTVICADSHGNKISSPVVGGTSVFSGLTPDTAYTVTLEVDGIHKLVGTTSKVYSTPIQTKVVQMSIVTGAESGSVILSFAVEGPDSDQWNVIYNAEGEAERVTTFPSHMVTLTGLTVGKEYTFRLEPVDDVYLSGAAEITYVAKNLICAENLRVTSCADGVLTVQWDTPVGETVSEWNVRCTNAAGFDAAMTTTENTVSFENIDDSAEYTIVVTAADMSVNQSVQVSANSITVTEFNVDTSKADKLSLSWKANRDVPAEGWTIRYSVDGVNAPATVTSKENSVTIHGVPNGNFVFTILDAEGNAVLGGPFTHTQQPAAAFEAYDLKQSDITIRLCKTPASSSWSYKDIADEDYVNSFSSGQKISMVLTAASKPSNSDKEVTLTYAIYDENDNLVSFSHDSQIWRSMWYQNHCELDISGIPAEIGTYKVVLLINGAEVGSQKFAITA